MSTMDILREASARRRGERETPALERIRHIQQRYLDDCVVDFGSEDQEACLDRAARRHRLALLLVLLEQPDGADRDLDVALDVVIGLKRPAAEGPAYTGSHDAARAFVAAALPGFWVSSGLCGLTGHAFLGPDYNGPSGERLRRDWTLDGEGTVETWDEDLAPGDGTHRECRAILACAVRALSYQHERQSRGNELTGLIKQVAAAAVSPPARAVDLPAVWLAHG
ncbi:hypothetical protein [Methylobacterium sp. J-067]|uniref:hypothetical protein n=1 Tax=Methylobacterium sp. J-067 TaxID=2836648 RepID=UPI001FBA78C1|nr:hypothetical protein [Methylobacterium sp. J-067]MCJ2025584.1 hypothetical protein [Methylobacterium sp. J-067]